MFTIVLTERRQGKVFREEHLKREDSVTAQDALRQMYEQEKDNWEKRAPDLFLDECEIPDGLGFVPIDLDISVSVKIVPGDLPPPTVTIFPGRMWQGSPIRHCDICNEVIANTFIDGGTKMGPCAILCTYCHAIYGVGLGSGRGQQYEKRGGEWVKIAG